MKLSVVIPLYNKEKFIDRCLKSLLAQDLFPNEYEIIVIDDGSTDTGKLIGQSYADKYPNIHFFSQENAGPSAARNRGLEATKGDYIYFLDADDYLAYNTLNRPLELCQQNNLDILKFNTKEVKEDALPDFLPQKLEDKALQVMDGITYIANFFSKNEAWRYLVKKEFLTDTGIIFTEGTLYEDAIFTVSLFLKANRMAKANLDIHRYVVVQDSIVTNRDPVHNLKFIHGMVNAVEIINDLIKGLNSSHVNYHGAVKRLKAKQQALVFALIIRTFKYRLLNFKDLKKILVKLNKLEVYPIDPKIGGVAKSKTSILPIINNKTLLFFGIGIRRLIPLR
jgi:glycosyltransferase involved in cell wall biosynthesis